MTTHVKRDAQLKYLCIPMGAIWIFHYLQVVISKYVIHFKSAHSQHDPHFRHPKLLLVTFFSMLNTCYWINNFNIHLQNLHQNKHQISRVILVLTNNLEDWNWICSWKRQKSSHQSFESLLSQSCILPNGHAVTKRQQLGNQNHCHQYTVASYRAPTWVKSINNGPRWPPNYAITHLSVL